MEEETRIEQMIKKILLLITFFVIGFAAWFVYEIITDKPPTFFPLNHPDGVYLITKTCPHGQGWTEQNPSQGNAYCIEYKGPDVLLNSENNNTNFFRITVGKSKIDLEPLVGKQVKSINGEYGSSSKQCIQNKCSEIGGPFVVLNIESIEENN